MQRPDEWVATASATASTATASKSASTAGARHCITQVMASFSAASIALLTVKKGTDTVFTQYVHSADVIPLELMGDVNEAVSAELASGGGGVVGVVTLLGYTN
jgi:hypothetical protein